MSRRLRCLRAWGGAPSPMGPRTRGQPLRKQAKSQSGPLQPRADDTPSRAALLQPRGLLLSLSCRSRRGLIWRRRCYSLLIQLETACFCRRSAAPSLPLSCAAACEASAKTVSGLRQVRSLRMLIHVVITGNNGMANTRLRCVIPTPRRLTARPAACRACHSDRSPVLSFTLSAWLLPLPSHVLQAMSLDCSGAAGAARKGEYRVRGFGGVFTFPL